MLSGQATGAASTASSSGTSPPASCVTLEDSSAIPALYCALPHLSNNQPYRPSASALPFAQVIIVAPVLQIITMVIGALILMLELPAPFVKGTAIHRNFVIRIVALLFLTAVAILFYQVCVIARNDSLNMLID